jgi:hypothetical protein
MLIPEIDLLKEMLRQEIEWGAGMPEEQRERLARAAEHQITKVLSLCRAGGEITVLKSSLNADQRWALLRYSDRLLARLHCGNALRLMPNLLLALGLQTVQDDLREVNLRLSALATLLRDCELPSLLQIESIAKGTADMAEGEVCDMLMHWGAMLVPRG